MPNIWTHIIFADELAEKTNLDTSKYIKIFHLGAQGPDPFFYHNFLPWKKDKSVAQIGGRIHKERCGEFLIEMLRFIKKSPDPALKYYAYGFFSHHILDRNTHPYIIYKSGEEGNKHQLLETTLDTILAKKYLGIDTWRNPAYKKIYVGFRLPISINKLLSYLLKQVHQIKRKDLNKIINKSYKEMLRAHKFLYDPTGLKNMTLKGFVSPYSHRKRYPEKDYLNLNNDIWLHPATKEESRESFYDIWERAEQDGIRVFNALNDFFANKMELEELQELLGNISYETGSSCDENLELRYFDPIV